MYEDILFQKQKGWHDPSEEFIREWEAYGLTPTDYYYAKQDFPDYYEYHWFWQEPKPGKQVFRKAHKRSIQDIKQCRIPEEIILGYLRNRFVEEINQHYFYAHNTRSNL